MANVLSTLSGDVLYQQKVGGDPDIIYEAAEFRSLIGALFDSGGIARTGDFLVKQRGAGANFSVDIAAGVAIVPGNGGATSREYYLVRQDSLINLSVTGMNTNPAATRTHAAYLAVYDKTIIGSTYGAALFLGEDTGSGAPTPTGNPVGYIRLGTFTIAPAQASIVDANITNDRKVAGRSIGWNTITLAAGFSAILPGYPPAWRRRGTTIEMRGGVTKAAGIPQGSTIATLPVGARVVVGSTAFMPFAGGTANDGTLRNGRLLVDSTGAMTVTFYPPPAGSSPQYMYLDGITYDTNE